MTKLAFYLFLALFGVAIASPILQPSELKLDARIVGGLNAKEGQFPYQVSLQRPNFGHFCGASVLNENWILTAAHCVPSITRDTQVVVGTSDFSKPEVTSVRHSIEEVIPHENFNANGAMANDLALIKVKGAITFTRNVQPIKLPEIDFNRENVPVIASGWGRLSLNGVRPEKLQYLQSFVFDHKECVKRMANTPMTFPPVNDNQICTFTQRGQGLCHGDSGGPIVTAGFQVGIVSMGYPCALGYPDVHTHVWKYVDWINQTMKNNEN